jgi:hypothetical protein
VSGRLEWFAPKRLGYGAGLPIAWQGWVVLGAYLLMALAGLLLRHSTVAFGSVVAALTGVLILVTANTTKGGWRWRGGD